jgi:hypothetical protein
MDIKTRKQKLLELNEKIREAIDDHEAGRFAILDGAVNLDRYFSSPIRIAWLLKEAYDDESGTGGGWSYTNLLDNDTIYEDFFHPHGSRTTWHPIIYASYGISKNFSYWDDMKYIRHQPDMAQVVRDIAIINGQKLPAFGITKTNNAVIAASIQNHIGFLAEQIKLLDPHILIGGNTMPYYFDALGLRPEDAVSTKTLKYHIKDNRAYIDAYHPAQRSVKRQDYIDDIIGIAELWHTEHSRIVPKELPTN